MLLFSAPALAVQTHAFSTSFGSAGEGAGELSSPAGVAMSSTTHDVYVADTGNLRVDEFEANGTFIRAWGWGVAEEHPLVKELQTCTLMCFKGEAGTGAGQLDSPEAITVDNSSSAGDPSKGDVYVTNTADNVIEKFNASGAYLGAITQGSGGAPFAGLMGVAVDPNGVLWVYDGAPRVEHAQIASYSDEQPNKFLASNESLAGGNAWPGFAVDSEDDLYVGHRESRKVAKVSGATGAVIDEEVGGEESDGVAVDQSDNVYIDVGKLIDLFSSSGTLTETFGSSHPVSGIGISVGSATGPVYVGDTAGDAVDVFSLGEAPKEAPKTEAAKEILAMTATLHGQLNPGGEPGALEYQFAYNTGPSCTGGQSTPVGSVANAKEALVEAKVTGLQPHARYTYCLIAINPWGTAQGAEVPFETLSAPPTIVSETVSHHNKEGSPLATGEARLEGVLNPNNQFAECHFQYGEASVEEHEVPCEPELLKGFGEQGVAATVGGLSGQPYHYRIIAKNGKGEKATGSEKTVLPPEAAEGLEAKPITASEATLHGVLNPARNHEAEPGTYEFVYRQSTTECQRENPQTGQKENEHTVAATTPPPLEGTPLGGEKEPVQGKIKGLLPGTEYTFCLLAKNDPGEEALSAPVTFTTVAELPAIESESVVNVAAESASLQAQVNPDGADTTYHFEYDTSEYKEGEAPHGVSAPVPDATIGSGAGGLPVGLHLQGLQAGTTYHYRVIATNAKGSVEGRDHTFTTQPAVASTALPDDRAWEQVSPADKHGALIYALGEYNHNGAVIQAAAHGGAITYVTAPSIENEPQGSSNFAQVLSVRGSNGWSSHDISVPHAAPTGQSLGQGQEYMFFSEDLSLGVVEPFGAFVPSLSPEASESTPYLRSNFVGGEATNVCTSSCYSPLVTGAPGYANVPPGTPFGAEYGVTCGGDLFCGPRFFAASPDGKHIVVSSEVALTSTPLPRGYNGLYEWSAGKLAMVSLLPGEGGPAGSFVTVGFDRDGGPHAVSDNGSRVVWSEFGGHLYLRDTVKGETVQLDAVQSGSGGQGSTGAAFYAASSDDSRVFFTDRQPLTEGSGEGEGEYAGDLYECEVVEVAEKLHCKLSDLTPPSGGEGADVHGVVGSSEDGSWVYFVADGELAPGAKRAHCEEEAGTCNLYVWHEGTTKLVAVLTHADLNDWMGGGGQLDNAYDQPARTSPNGHWLTFMSGAPLSTYDNHDAVTGQPDAEVYLYHAPENLGTEPGTLVCASCDPTGARPVAAPGRSESIQDVVWNGPVAASVPGWTPFSSGLSLHQSRYLSNSGRLFFNSYDALVPQDINGTWDVYEYEPTGYRNEEGAEQCNAANATYSERSGGCAAMISSGGAQEAGFLESSESGGDVFFLTAAQLSPQDKDSALDIYDAHECTAAAPCFASPPTGLPPCTSGDSCKPPPTPQPLIFGAPASATFSGQGNAPPPSSPKKVTKKTAKCKKHFVKTKKGKCVRVKTKSKAKKSNHRSTKSTHGKGSH